MQIVSEYFSFPSKHSIFGCGETVCTKKTLINRFAANMIQTHGQYLVVFQTKTENDLKYYFLSRCKKHKTCVQNASRITIFSLYLSGFVAVAFASCQTLYNGRITSWLSMNVVDLPFQTLLPNLTGSRTRARHSKSRFGKIEGDEPEI